jgi:hypothetical protein
MFAVGTILEEKTRMEWLQSFTKEQQAEIIMGWLDDAYNEGESDNNSYCWGSPSKKNFCSEKFLMVDKVNRFML